MKQARSFPERLETALIIGLCIGIALIAQTYSVVVFRVGLTILVVSTFLQIAVGNLRKDANVWQSLKFIAIILCVVAAIFTLGIVLVPTFSTLGQ